MNLSPSPSGGGYGPTACSGDSHGTAEHLGTLLVPLTKQRKSALRLSEIFVILHENVREKRKWRVSEGAVTDATEGGRRRPVLPPQPPR